MMKEKALTGVHLVVGGVIPRQDIQTLEQMGVAAVFPGGTAFDTIVAEINQLFA